MDRGQPARSDSALRHPQPALPFVPLSLVSLVSLVVVPLLVQSIPSLKTSMRNAGTA